MKDPQGQVNRGSCDEATDDEAVRCFAQNDNLLR
jgi:hypothetical protein